MFPKRSVKGKQGNCFDKDWADKKRGSSQKLWDTLQQLNPAAVVVPGNSVAVILWLYSSVLIIWTRKQFVLFPIQFITIILTQLLASRVSSTCFLPCLTRSASRILRRIIKFCPGYFQVCSLFRLFRHCSRWFGRFIIQFISRRNKNSGSCDETLPILQ